MITDTIVDIIIESQTHSIGLSITMVKNKARGAVNPKTRIEVITNIGNPLPKPWRTRPMVIPTAING